MAAAVNLVRYSSVTSVESYSSLEGANFASPLTQALPVVCVTTPEVSSAAVRRRSSCASFVRRRESIAEEVFVEDERTNSQTITDHVCVEGLKE